MIADDGSSDGTLEWLIDDLESDESNIVVIRNDGLGIARQTNSILDYILSSDLNQMRFSCVMMIFAFSNPGGTKNTIQQC